MSTSSRRGRAVQRPQDAPTCPFRVELRPGCYQTILAPTLAYCPTWRTALRLAASNDRVVAVHPNGTRAAIPLQGWLDGTYRTTGKGLPRKDRNRWVRENLILF